MDRTVYKNVMTNVMVVTTSMVPVIEDVNRAGRDTTVNNVIILPNTIFYFLKMLLIMAYYV